MNCLSQIIIENPRRFDFVYGAKPIAINAKVSQNTADVPSGG